MTDKGVPNPREELNAKTFETMEWLFDSVRNGTIDDCQFSTGVDALFMAVCGLVDDSFVDLVTQASALAREAICWNKRHFVKGDNLISVRRLVGAEEFEVVGRHNGVPAKIVKKPCETSEEAKTKAAAFCETLIRNGYEEL